VSVCFFLFVGAVLADVTMRDIWRWGLVRKTDVLQIGALTNELDLAALRTYHYGSPDIVESPAGWFVFDGDGTIIGYNYSAGRTNVVIPWAIGGVPVTAIGANAFESSAIVSVSAPQTVTAIGVFAFGYCDSLASVSLPQATAIGNNAFRSCGSLASVSLPQVTSIGDYAFSDCTSLTSVRMGRNAPAEAEEVFYGIDPPTVYVTDPQATGWGDTWNGAPVVRPNLYADAVYQAGELVATTAALAVHTNRADNPHSVTAVQIGALTAELDPVANAALAVHTNRTDNPHGVTAAQVGALTAEQDLAALRTYHYGSPDIVESPAEWFTFADGVITGFNWETGRTNVVIPWAIGGVPVTAIGANAFQSSAIVSVIAPQTVTTIGAGAFGYCDSLASVTLPQATTIGDGVFYGCEGLTGVHMGQNAPAEATEVFADITPPPNVYVTDPQATGWGATWNGVTVVRPPLYADAIYQAGELVATTGHVAQAIAAIPEPDLSDRPTFAQIAASNALPYTAWTGTVAPQNGTATVAYAHGNMPVLVTDAPCVLTLDPTGYGTAGVSRVSLSYYTGTNSFTFATNIIDYAATPTVDTNGWNTLLIRRVSDGAWKGVGL
jgi:hypothetical protein